MKILRDIFILFALAVLAIMLGFVAYAEKRRAHMEDEISWTATLLGIQIEAGREQALALLDQHATAIRRDVISEVQLTREAAVREIERSRKTLSGDLGATAGILDTRLQSLQTDANLHGLVLEKLIARELGRAVDGWGEVATEVQATLAESRRTVHDLHPQILGLVAASKITAGDAAKAARTFDARFPVLLDTFQQTNQSVAEMAGAAQKWVGFQLGPKSKKQNVFAVIERFGLIGIRAWLLL